MFLNLSIIVEEIFRLPYLIMGSWYNEELSETFTFTENDVTHKRGKTKEYFATKFKDEDEYIIGEEIIDNLDTCAVTRYDYPAVFL